MKYFRIKSGDIDFDFDLPVSLAETPSEKLTFLNIQLAITDALEERQKLVPKGKVGGWGLIGELWVNGKPSGYIPMIPYLADAGAAQEVAILEFCLCNSDDAGIKLVYALALANYNKNSFKLT
jgi:hypothetical protein